MPCYKIIILLSISDKNEKHKKHYMLLYRRKVTLCIVKAKQKMKMINRNLYENLKKLVPKTTHLVTKKFSKRRKWFWILIFGKEIVL